MRRDEAQILFVRCLLRQVRACSYLSAPELDYIERVMPRSMLGEYVQVLVDKVGKDRYPSIWLLRRIERLSEYLPSPLAPEDVLVDAGASLEQQLEEFRNFLDDVSADDFGDPSS